MEGAEEFARQLTELGFEINVRDGARVAVAYTITGGSHAGAEVRLGFEVPPEFPRSPPGGPHLSPRLFPMNPNAAGHPERVADSKFGADWQYLSRPYAGWRGREPVAKYLAYIARLFATS